jgi:hypothetical protein
MTRIRLYAAETRPGGLPPLCLVCGRQAVAHVSRTFSWRPPDISLGFWFSVFVCPPVGLVVFVIGLIRTRRMTVESPVCERHRHYWAWRGFWVAVPILVLAAAVIALGVVALTDKMDEEVFGFLFAGAIGLLVVWAVTVAVLQRTGVRVVRITDEDITLEPVSAEFAAAVRAERQGVRREPGEEYDPYPG